jgi:hypothetical protein
VARNHVFTVIDQNRDIEAKCLDIRCDLVYLVMGVDLRVLRMGLEGCRGKLDTLMLLVVISWFLFLRSTAAE